MAKVRPRRPRAARSVVSAPRSSPPVSAAQKMDRTLDAVPDRIDIRDWVYRPNLGRLPDRLINCENVPEILDQGQEGACAGFALAAVINYHLAQRNVRRSVSARMLYEMARRYDEWPGESYSGSSARGAVKGWIAHGVCSHSLWPDGKHGLAHFDPALSQAARATPGGAYYRVAHREIRDMHAALAESGILYATLMVHAGWMEPGEPDNLVRELGYVENGNLRTRKFPVIQRKGRADGGHAVAIVGYTSEGFIIQNSWGRDWGAEGFALLPYADFLIHATDVWVVQVGVPVDLDLWMEGKAADTTAGVQRASQAVPLAEIRPFVVDVGNNGELSTSGHYWTTEADLKRLFSEEIRDRTATWPKVPLLLYLHGGLNDEDAAARRIVSFRDVMLENQIYPLHIMWETGVMQSLGAMMADLFTDDDERAGSVADWLDRFRKGLAEARDRSIELTVSRLGTRLWDEMKENAALASKHRQGKGAMQLLAKYAQQAVEALSAEQRKRFELHVVAHSAGSEFAAHALPHLLKCGIPLASLHLMAPAISVDAFKRLMLPSIQSGTWPQPSLFILSDAAERDDSIGPYGKSLLYLVSNAFEGRRATPLLGLECFVSEGSQLADPAVARLFKESVGSFPSLMIAQSDPNAPQTPSPDRAQSRTHGGFDNDPATMNSILWRVLRKKPQRLFLDRDLKFE